MPQLLRPIGINTLSGSITGSFTDVDESVPSDIDYVYGASGGGNSVEFTLSNPPNTPNMGTITLRVRLAETYNNVLGSSGGGGFNSKANPIDVSVRDNLGSIILQGSFSPSSWQTFSLSQEILSIGGWNGITITVSDASNGGKGDTRRGLGVSWVELEVPDPDSSSSGVLLNNLDLLYSDSNSDLDLLAELNSNLNLNSVSSGSLNLTASFSRVFQVNSISNSFLHLISNSSNLLDSITVLSDSELSDPSLLGDSYLAIEELASESSSKNLIDSQGINVLNLSSNFRSNLLIDASYSSSLLVYSTSNSKILINSESNQSLSLYSSVAASLDILGSTNYNLELISLDSYSSVVQGGFSDLALENLVSLSSGKVYLIGQTNINLDMYSISDSNIDLSSSLINSLGPLVSDSYSNNIINSLIGTDLLYLQALSKSKLILSTNLSENFSLISASNSNLNINSVQVSDLENLVSYSVITDSTPYIGETETTLLLYSNSFGYTSTFIKSEKRWLNILDKQERKISQLISIDRNLSVSVSINRLLEVKR